MISGLTALPGALPPAAALPAGKAVKPPLVVLAAAAVAPQPASAASASPFAIRVRVAAAAGAPPTSAYLAASARDAAEGAVETAATAPAVGVGEADDVDSLASAAGVPGGGGCEGADGDADDGVPVKPSTLAHDCSDATWLTIPGGHRLEHGSLTTTPTSTSCSPPPVSVVAGEWTVASTVVRSCQRGANTALTSATRDFPLADGLGRLLDHVASATGQSHTAGEHAGVVALCQPHAVRVTASLCHGSALCHASTRLHCRC